MSQVNWNRQLGLAIALFASGTLAYWLEFKHRPDQESAQELSKKVFQFKEQQIHSIAVTQGTRNVVFDCSDLALKLCKAGDNSKWEVAEPIRSKADDTNVNSLLSALNTLTSTDTFDLKGETPEKRAALLKEYGLDRESRLNPKTTRNVRVTTENGDAVLYLGATHPIGESIFAVVESVVPSGQKPTADPSESAIYLIPSVFKANFEHELTYWRNKKLLTIGAHETAEFVIESRANKPAGAKTTVTGQKSPKPDSHWTLKSGALGSGESMPGDSENIENLLSSIAGLTAKEVISENKASTEAKNAVKGFTETLTVTLQKEKPAATAPAPNTSPNAVPTATGEAPIVLHFLRSKDGKILATVSNLDPVYEVDVGTINRFNKTLSDLRFSKLITSMDRFGAKHLEFAGPSLGNLPLVLNQENGKWSDQDKTAPMQIAQEKVQELLERLTSNSIKEFLTGGSLATVESGSEKSKLLLTLKGDASDSQKQLVFWRKNGELYAKDLGAKKSNLNEGFKLDASLSQVLPWDKNHLKAPAPNPSSTPAAAPTPKQ